jgi:glycosyltransferase involved in cell wall biosynthesis
MRTVLSIAYPFAPVGPDLVGGAEQILANLDQAIVAAGDRSLVVACEGSQPRGKLFALPIPKNDRLEEVDRSWCRAQFRAAVDRALRSEDVDLIHAHCMDLYEYEFPAGVPLLITLHMPVEWYRREMIERYERRATFCYVSQSQRRAGLPLLGEAHVIANGVDVSASFVQTAKADFALVLGRICPEKNAHAALEAGTRAGIRVVIGGQVYPYGAHQAYFEDKIKPLLCNAGNSGITHEFVGPLTAERRQQLLTKSKCLLHPTLAPETSSLVAMEALAAGTPVIAYRSGALPEIVEDGVTGFLVDNVEQMAAAVGKVHSISPEVCHEAAERRFSKQTMIARYFDLYDAMIHRGRVVADAWASD